MKIAILSGGRSDKIGGIETYNYNLISFLLEQKHEITEFYEKKDSDSLRNTHNINYSDIFEYSGYFNEMKLRRKWKEMVSNISIKFDLVIISGGPYYWDFKLKNVLFIQHFNHDYYINKLDNKSLKLKKMFDSLFSLLPYKLDPISKSKNVLYFDKETVSPRARKDQRFFSNIPFYLKEEKYNFKRSGLLYVGRLENQQKNIKKLVKNVENVDYYGDGVLKKWLIKKVGGNYKGRLETKNVRKTMARYKFLVVPSNYEGCALVVQEAASVGTPSIIFDTYDYAKIYGKLGIARLIEHNKWQDFNEAFLEKIINKKIFDIQKKYFSRKTYEEKWINIIQALVSSN